MRDIQQTCECFLSDETCRSKPDTVHTAEPSVQKKIPTALVQFSDQKDRRDVAEAAFGAINAMELSGQMDPDVAAPMRFSCKKTLYGSQGWEGEREDEEEVLSIRSDKIRRGSTGLRQFRRVRAIATPSSSSAATSDQLTLLTSPSATG